MIKRKGVRDVCEREEGFSHICGKACAGRKAEERGLGVIVDNTDDSTTQGHDSTPNEA